MNRGQKAALRETLGDGPVTLEVDCRAPGGTDVDVVAFGLDAAGKLVGDPWMVFYNQMQAPANAIVKLPVGHSFVVDTARLPAQVQRVSLCLTLDGPATMNQVPSLSVVLRAQRTTDFRMSGSDFGGEKAVMLVDLYRHQDGWRIGCVGQGFAGGLAALLRHVGGQEAPTVASAPTRTAPASPNPSTVSLEKRVAAAAPQLVSLAKAASVSLEKAKLGGIRARVALVLDVSGSMYGRYTMGEVQKVVDRILPLAVHFDDDGELDTWAYADKSKRLPAATLSNVAKYIESAAGGWRNWKVGGGNHEPAVIEDVMNEFGNSTLPAYVVFITDGGIYAEAAIKQLLIKASTMPIFWQFVGLGGSGYGVLQRLDTMAGRKVDNAGFFAIDGLAKIPDAKLYDMLLSEFPDWLKAARAAGILRG